MPNGFKVEKAILFCIRSVITSCYHLDMVRVCTPSLTCLMRGGRGAEVTDPLGDEEC